MKGRTIARVVRNAADESNINAAFTLPGNDGNIANTSFNIVSMHIKIMNCDRMNTITINCRLSRSALV